MAEALAEAFLPHGPLDLVGTFRRLGGPDEGELIGMGVAIGLRHGRQGGREFPELHYLVESRMIHPTPERLAVACVVAHAVAFLVGHRGEFTAIAWWEVVRRAARLHHPALELRLREAERGDPSLSGEDDLEAAVVAACRVFMAHRDSFDAALGEALAGAGTSVARVALVGALGGAALGGAQLPAGPGGERLEAVAMCLWERGASRLEVAHPPASPAPPAGPAPGYRTLRTLKRPSPFEVKGTVATGTRIRFPRGTVRFGPEEWQALLDRFGAAGTVVAGMSRDDPPPGSVGRYLLETRGLNLASYLVPILVEAGLASVRSEGRTLSVTFSGLPG